MFVDSWSIVGGRRDGDIWMKWERYWNKYDKQPTAKLDDPWERRTLDSNIYSVWQRPAITADTDGIVHVSRNMIITHKRSSICLSAVRWELWKCRTGKWRTKTPGAAAAGKWWTIYHSRLHSSNSFNIVHIYCLWQCALFSPSKNFLFVINPSCIFLSCVFSRVCRQRKAIGGDHSRIFKRKGERKRLWNEGQTVSVSRS